jgi:hypothetical protein
MKKRGAGLPNPDFFNRLPQFEHQVSIFLLNACG